ncbi:hypothetical protein [Diplocloster hominis]|uniref:hypothetical protein n=1 Tax=Diplocloster hominis TaxID=3079010 RepID=UPI0031BA0A83
MLYNFPHTRLNVVHFSNPFKLFFSLKLFCYSLPVVIFLYQPRKHNLPAIHTIDFETRLRAKYKDGYVPTEIFLAIRQKDNRVAGMIDFRPPLKKIKNIPKQKRILKIFAEYIN